MTYLGETSLKSQKNVERDPSDVRLIIRLITHNPISLVGAIIVAFSVVLAIIAPIIVNPHSWEETNLGLRLCWNNPIINWHIQNMYVCPTKTVYPLGTDAYGRNLLDMIILALPLDLKVSMVIVGVSCSIGTIIGSLAAYYGGIMDELVLRLTDVFYTFPGLLLAIVIVTVVGRSIDNLMLALLVTHWPVYVRIIRSQVLSEKEKPYVEALRSLGIGGPRIIFRHIIPNSIWPIVVQATLSIGGIILQLSSLMFLGFTPNPLTPELGNLVSEGINHVFTAPWLIVFPGLTILILVLGFSLLGDGLRDALDPRLRR